MRVSSAPLRGATLAGNNEQPLAVRLDGLSENYAIEKRRKTKENERFEARLSTERIGQNGTASQSVSQKPRYRKTLLILP